MYSPTARRLSFAVTTPTLTLRKGFQMSLLLGSVRDKGSLHDRVADLVQIVRHRLQIKPGHGGSHHGGVYLWTINELTQVRERQHIGLVAASVAAGTDGAADPALADALDAWQGHG